MKNGGDFIMKDCGPQEILRVWFLHPVVVDMFPTSHQDQFSNSSKIDEKMLGGGWENYSKILKWVWQPACVVILGRGTKGPSQSAMPGATPSCSFIIIDNSFI